MTSQQFIDFLERKLVEHGVKKVVPDKELLRQAYTNAYRTAMFQEIINREYDRIANMEITIPQSLSDEVVHQIDKKPIAWDEAIARIARRNVPNEE